MKIAILGFGVEGQAAYEYFLEGNEITVCDQNDSLELPSDVSAKLGEGYLQGLDEFDVIVRSPFVHPSKIVAANSPTTLDKVTSNTNEFFKACPTNNIIGITGTKGKGTTSTLVAKMLEATGKTVHLGGNIGVAPLELLKNNIQADDWVVLELSSFQLIDLKYSPHIAVCLMVVPEHLDYHADTQEYFEAKGQLFRWQTTQDIAVYFAGSETSAKIAGNGDGQKIPYYRSPGAIVEQDEIKIGDTVLCKTSELKLLGQHNWQNVCAAVTAIWQVTKDNAAIRSVLTTFSGLEHRLEFVREVNGVKYYDDSFGTTPETAIVAIQAFAEPKIVILGGSDKGATYDELAKAVVSGNVRHAITIGITGPAIADALMKAGYDNGISGGTNMEEIVKEASLVAEPGDIVLLSTACASFGMFKNYKDRGEQFKAAVNALANQ